MSGATALFSLNEGKKQVDDLVPKPPELPPVPTAPELDTSAQAERDEAARKERERRALSGRASTVLTGGRGDLTTPQLGSAILLGQ